MLIVGRAVAGLGSSGLINGALTIIAACVPLAKRPVHLGIMMSISQLGIVLGPVIGGALTQYTTWRWCFYINLPIGGATAALLVFITIPDRTAETRGTSLASIVREKLDLLGFMIFAPFAIQFFLALEWGGTRYRWDSATVIGLFCGAAGTFCLFLGWEYRKGDAAMVPFSMIKNKVIWSSCLVQVFFFGGMLSMSYYLPIYFQAVKGVSPTLSGVYLLPSILTQMLFSVISGVLGILDSESRIGGALTGFSGENRLLPPLERCLWHPDFCRIWAVINLYTNLIHRFMGRLSNHHRCWTWMRAPNSEPPSMVNTVSYIANFLS